MTHSLSGHFVLLGRSVDQSRDSRGQQARTFKTVFKSEQEKKINGEIMTGHGMGNQLQKKTVCF